jgi:hypothetical protein
MSLTEFQIIYVETSCSRRWKFIPSSFFWQYWGLNSRPTPWATPPALFCDGFFQNRVSRTICPSWFWTAILLITTSQVARISGVTRWHPGNYALLLSVWCFGFNSKVSGKGQSIIFQWRRPTHTVSARQSGLTSQW